MRVARLLLFLGIVVASTCCAVSRETEKHWLPVHAESEQPPLFALWSEPPNNVYLVGTKLPGLVVAAWPDGRVVFSKDVNMGGPPFAGKQVEPAKVVAIRDRARGIVRSMKGSGYAIPDAGGSTLFIQDPDASVTVYAVHELMPSWTPWNDPAAYERFVGEWNEATAIVRGLIDPSTPTTTDRELFRFENVALPSPR